MFFSEKNFCQTCVFFGGDGMNQLPVFDMWLFFGCKLEVMRDICLLLLLFIAPLVAALTLQGTLALALLATSREA